MFDFAKQEENEMKTKGQIKSYSITGIDKDYIHNVVLFYYAYIQTALMQRQVDQVMHQPKIPWRVHYHFHFITAFIALNLHYSHLIPNFISGRL